MAVSELVDKICHLFSVWGLRCLSKEALQLNEHRVIKPLMISESIYRRFLNPLSGASNFINIDLANLGLLYTTTLGQEQQ